MVREGPTDDAPRAKVNHYGQIEPAGGGGDKGNVTGPSLIRADGKSGLKEAVGRGAIGPAVAGLRGVGSWLKGSSPRLEKFQAAYCSSWLGLCPGNGITWCAPMCQTPARSITGRHTAHGGPVAAPAKVQLERPVPEANIQVRDQRGGQRRYLQLTCVS